MNAKQIAWTAGISAIVFLGMEALNAHAFDFRTAIAGGAS